MDKSISSIEYASLLYDFYGELLDDGKREVMDLYHEDNLSLAEIAEEQRLTRQAVHYSLKKAEARLQGYEQKLGLVKNYLERQKRLASTEKMLEDFRKDHELPEDVSEVVDSLMETLREFSE